MDMIKQIFNELKEIKKVIFYEAQNDKMTLLEIQAIRRLLEKQW